MFSEGRGFSIDRTNSLPLAPTRNQRDPLIALYFTRYLETLGAMPNAIGRLFGAKASSRGEEVDGFEDASFSCAISTQKKMRPPCGAPIEGLQVPKFATGKAREHDCASGGSPLAAQILIGMITQR